jgi:hypothetical protein
MADTKLTGLASPTGGPAFGDYLYLVDVSDTTDNAAGSSRKVLTSDILNLLIAANNTWVGINGFSKAITAAVTDTGVNTVVNVLGLDHTATGGSAAAGHGAGLLFTGTRFAATTPGYSLGRLRFQWVALNYTKGVLSIFDTTVEKDIVAFDTNGATVAGTLAATGAVTGSNLSGTNTGDQTINLTGPVTGTGTGTVATTITAGAVTNAMLAGSIDLTSKVTGALPAANLTARGCGLSRVSTGVSIGSGAWTAVGFDAEDWDAGGYHDNVTNNTRVTIPTGLGGKYLLTASVQFAGNATGLRDVRFFKNGTATVGGLDQRAANSTNTVNFIVSAVVNLVAGDYVELQAFQSSGGSLSIDYAAGYSPVFTATFLGG